jgi:hypothetical protein
MILQQQTLLKLNAELLAGRTDFTHIGKELGISRPTVRAHAKLLGVHKGNKYKIKVHTLNLDYFKNIDSQEKAYILGMMYADGCNTRKGLALALDERDKDVLEFVKQQFSASETLKFIPAARPNWCNKWELRICSRELSEQLTRLGCPPAKSLILRFPEFIPEGLLPHFIRGYFDGDGSLLKHNEYWRLSIVCASSDFIVPLKNYIESKLGEIVLLYKNKSNNGYSLKSSKISVITGIIKLIYTGSIFSMHRKCLHAYECIKEKGGSYYLSTP